MRMSAEDLRQQREAFLQWMEANDLNPNGLASACKLTPSTLYDFVAGRTKSLSAATVNKVARALDLPVEAIFGSREPVNEQNNVRAWREYRQMSREELAKAVTTTPGILAELEEGRIPLSGKWLRRLSVPLRTTGGFIFDHRPEDLPSGVLEMFDRAEADNTPRPIVVMPARTAVG